jgi:hypothetical protein
MYRTEGMGRNKEKVIRRSIRSHNNELSSFTLEQARRRKEEDEKGGANENEEETSC